MSDLASSALAQFDLPGVLTVAIISTLRSAHEHGPEVDEVMNQTREARGRVNYCAMWGKRVALGGWWLRWMCCGG